MIPEEGHFGPLWGTFRANGISETTFFECRGCIPLVARLRCYRVEGAHRHHAFFSPALPPWILGFHLLVITQNELIRKKRRNSQFLCWVRWKWSGAHTHIIKCYQCNGWISFPVGSIGKAAGSLGSDKFLCSLLLRTWFLQCSSRQRVFVISILWNIIA